MKKTKRHLKVKRSKKLFSTTYFKDNYQKTLKMSSFETNEKIDNLLYVYTKPDEDSRTRLLEEINNEIDAFLSKERTEEDSLSVWFFKGFISLRPRI